MCGEQKISTVLRFSEASYKWAHETIYSGLKNISIHLQRPKCKVLHDNWRIKLINSYINAISIYFLKFKILPFFIRFLSAPHKANTEEERMAWIPAY